jgi:hypothetical protein
MLKFLFGMLAGYLVASIEMTRWLIQKGYRSIRDVPDNE